MRTNAEMTEIYKRNQAILYKICYLYMKNSHDAEDILTETFCKLIDKAPAFDSFEHEKAWLIRVATNLCKNQLKSWWRRHEDLEDYKELIGMEDQEDQYSELLNALMCLPDKYKTVVVLYYYEGYKSEEISGIIGKPASTIRNYLCDPSFGFSTIILWGFEVYFFISSQHVCWLFLMLKKLDKTFLFLLSI